MSSILQSLVECPVCFSIRVKYFQCKNGHTICHGCVERLENKVCPSCNVKYLNDPIRSLQTERFVAEHKFEVVCRNDSDGCKFSGLSQEVENHEQECIYRLVTCKYAGCEREFFAKDQGKHEWFDHIPCPNEEFGCNFNGTLSMLHNHRNECKHKITCTAPKCQVKIMRDEMINHLREWHKFVEFRFHPEGDLTLWHLNLNTRPFLIHYDSDSFLNVVERIQENTHVYLIGLTKDAEAKFEIQMKAYAKEKRDKMEITRKSRVFSLNAENAHFQECQECLIVSDIQINQLKDGSLSKVWIDYKLTRI